MKRQCHLPVIKKKSPSPPPPHHSSSAPLHRVRIAAAHHAMAPAAVEPPLPDEVLDEIFLRLGAAEDLARASAACTTFRRVACADRFLRRYRSLNPPPILGFVPYRAVLFKHPVHLAQPPHRHAPAAHALAQAADPAFSFHPYAGHCTVHDARDGRVLISRNLSAIPPHGLVVCDPVHRRYVPIPRIPGDLLDLTGYIPKMKFETFLAPALEAEDDSSFRVLCNVLSQDKVVALLFSSVTRAWCCVTSFTFPPDAKIQHYDSVRHYARSSSRKNSKVKRAWPGAISGWVTDREVLPGCARVRTKCAEKTCVGFCAGMVRMAGVGPEWSHSMAHALALDARTWPRGDVPGLGLTDEDVGLLRGSSRKNSKVKRAWPGAISGWVTDREVLPGCQACGPGLERRDATWTMRSWDKMLVLGTREFKFSISDLPSGIDRHQGVGIVDGGDDKTFLFTPKNNVLDHYCGTLGDNAVGVEKWQHKRMIPLPELNCRWFVIGATEGHLLLESVPNDVPLSKLAQVQRPCFTVDYKTLLVERMCVLKWGLIRAAHLYVSFPPPLSPPSI
ncbi:hypothetical protein EJB05_27557, partial [Eragrostis curvula]